MELLFIGSDLIFELYDLCFFRIEAMRRNCESAASSSSIVRDVAPVSSSSLVSEVGKSNESEPGVLVTFGSSSVVVESTSDNSGMFFNVC